MPKFSPGDRVLCVTLKGSNYAKYIARVKKLDPKKHPVPGSTREVSEVFDDPEGDYLCFTDQEFGENACCFVRATLWNLVYYKTVLFFKKVFYAT